LQDVSRLKANHRSSLASLAEFHRSEMAGLNASHVETMKKMELQHMEELRNARRTNGHDRELVQGLHQSYGQQIESLVLDLSEARRELKELKLKQPLSDSATATDSPAPIDTAVEEVHNRTLAMRLSFQNLDAPLAIVELAVPHPGPSFDSLLRILSFSVKNHLQTLNTTANFFICRPREEHVEAALKINHWYNSALEERVHFTFTSPEANSDGSTMKERWEDGQWKMDNLLLGVTCTAEGWENFTIPSFTLGALDNGAYTQGSGVSGLGLRMSTGRSASVEPLVNELVYNPAIELERALGNLRLQQEQADPDEDKENHVPTPPVKNPSRKATVESVRDEDDISLTYEPAPPVKTVPTANPPKARQPTVDDASPIIWEDGQPGSTARSINMSLEEGLKELLEKDIEEAKLKGKTSGPADSWLFDDLFSPLPEVDQRKEDGTDGLFFRAPESGLGAYRKLASVYPQSTVDEPSSKAPSLMDPLIFKDDSSRYPGFGWRWLSEDLNKSSISSPSDRRPTPAAKSYANLPARDTWNTPGGSSNSHERGEGRSFTSGLFSFAGARLSPPPPAPPAPEASTRDSPTIPSYAQTDVGTSHDQGESAHGNDDFPAETADGTPVMETAQSIVSSTPLLSDATGQRSVRFAGKKRSYPTEHAGERMPPPPFPPSSTGGPRGNDSPQSSKYSASRYESQGYFRSGSNETQQAPGGWGGSQSSAVSDYEPESIQGNKPHAYPPASEAYTWEQNEEDEEGDDEADEEDGYRAASVSPPPSRSSGTTTDHHNTGFMPKNYGQQPANQLGTPFRYGFGGMIRPMSMGPLGPRGGIPAFTSPQHADMIYQQQFEQQVRQRMEEIRMRSGMADLFAGVAGGFGPPPRSSTAAPTFVGGTPVFAPNPPHSVAARSTGGVPIGSQYPNSQTNGSAVAGSAVNSSAMNGISRYPFDSWPISSPSMPLHMGHRHQQHRPPLFGGNGEVRRSFSNDSLSPLLWNTGAAEQQQHPSPQNSNEQPLPGSYPGMMHPWQMGNSIGQVPSSTPVSQVHSHHGMPPSWFQQPNVAPYEVNWDGSPMSMRMPPGLWSGYST
jgi:hypothetical protein